MARAVFPDQAWMGLVARKTVNGMGRPVSPGVGSGLARHGRAGELRYAVADVPVYFPIFPAVRSSSSFLRADRGPPSPNRVLPYSRLKA